MTDFKVVLPTTTEEWQRDMNIAYNQGRLDEFQEIISEYNMLLTEEQVEEIRTDVIDECIKALDEYIEFPMTDEYAIKECIRVLEDMKEQNK